MKVNMLLVATGRANSKKSGSSAAIERKHNKKLEFVLLTKVGFTSEIL